MLVVEAGPIAENSTGSLRRFRPDVVILLDAAWFGGEPGEIRGLDWHEADGFSASTHTVPMSVFANYLESEFGCQVLLLAIQAASVEFGDPVSLPVRRAVRRLVRGLHTLLFSITE